MCALAQNVNGKRVMTFHSLKRAAAAIKLDTELEYVLADWNVFPRAMARDVQALLETCVRHSLRRCNRRSL